MSSALCSRASQSSNTVKCAGLNLPYIAQVIEHDMIDILYFLLCICAIQNVEQDYVTMS
jgi:hypothetical protein